MIRSRYRRILWFFGRVIASFIVWQMVLPRIGFGALSRSSRAERFRRIAAAFRALAVQMGGVMIKVGQFLSARLDVLPGEITDELAGLQDEVLPEPFEAVRQVIETEMNAPLEARFARFDPLPIASASIGQVHRAWTAGMTAEEPAVVVKVQRPNIQAVVDTDLAALRVVSRWIHAYPPIRRRVNIPALMEEFSRTLYEEIDYLHEGKNAETFAENFIDRPLICVPRVIWSHTTRRVLALEEIHGIKITDYAAIEAAGINRAEVADQLIDIYLKQIFEDRFFHADPHPGNLFVAPREQGWQIIFVDFGMAGVVHPNQFAALREMLIAAGTQDVPRLIRSYEMMGILLPGADIDLLEKATQKAFQRVWGKSTAEIVSLGTQEAVAFAQEFRQLLYQMPFQVPENLVLLGRCMGILSGICSGLNPDFNVWESILPYARQLMQSEGGGISNVFVKESLNTLRILAGFPARASALLDRVEQGRLEVRAPELRGSITRLERQLERLAVAVVFMALFLGSVQLYIAGTVTLAAVSAAAAAVTLLWLIIRR